MPEITNKGVLSSDHSLSAKRMYTINAPTSGRRLSCYQKALDSNLLRKQQYDAIKLSFLPARAHLMYHILFLQNQSTTSKATAP